MYTLATQPGRLTTLRMEGWDDRQQEKREEARRRVHEGLVEIWRERVQGGR